MTEKSSTSRREVLKNAGAAGIAALGASGTVAAQGRRSHRAGPTAFDPENDGEVADFLDYLREKHEGEREAVVNTLSEEQVLAVNRALMPASIESSSRRVSAQSSNPPYLEDVKGKSTLGFKIYTLFHEIDWSSWSNQVDSDAWVSVSDPLFKNHGIDGSLSFVDGFEARKTGRVEALYNVEYKGISAGFEMTPVIHLQALSGGDYAIYEKDDGM